MGRSDLELARAVSEGEREAAEELAGRLFQRVRATCRYLVGAHHDWEDLVQVVMIEILKSAGSYSGEASLEKWAGTIIMRTMWRQIRKRERYKEIIRIFRSRKIQSLPGQSGEAENVVDNKFLRSRMAGHLDGINYKQRMCLVMKLVFGHTVKEIAQVTGSSENTVKDRLKKGREKLRRLVLNDEELSEYVSHLNTGVGP